MSWKHWHGKWDVHHRSSSVSQKDLKTNIEMTKESVGPCNPNSYWSDWMLSVNQQKRRSCFVKCLVLLASPDFQCQTSNRSLAISNIKCSPTYIPQYPKHIPIIRQYLIPIIYLFHPHLYHPIISRLSEMCSPWLPHNRLLVPGTRRNGRGSTAPGSAAPPSACRRDRPWRGRRRGPCASSWRLGNGTGIPWEDDGDNK